MSDTPPRELDLPAALEALLAALRPVTETHSVAIADSPGRVLAADLIAPFDLPSFDNAAMDGYAVRAADCSTHANLRVVGTALAGHPFAGQLGVGEAVRITTGAPMPSGADAVVMQEDVEREGDRIAFTGRVKTGQNVRAAGEHVRAGTVVLRKGTTLCAAETGLATALGVTQLPVYRQLSVGLASTGDELADPPMPLTATGSYDGNRPLFAVACRSAGFAVTDLGICPDRAPAFAQLVERARAQRLDALLISGGSALGDADVVRQAQAVRFLAVNMRPGRGITFASIGEPAAPFALLGLPGNAVAAFVMFHLLVLPALRHLAGGRAMVPEHLPLPLATDLVCQPNRVDYRRGRIEYDAAGEPMVRPLEQQGAGMLRTLVDADVLIAAGPKAQYRAGERVGVVLLASLPG